MLRCPAGHAYDRAREGYWNLLHASDRRSATAGDAVASLDARGRLIERGLADGVIAALRAEIDKLGLPRRARIVDLGCGDGALLMRALAGRDVTLCGIDLAVPAVARAARKFSAATWIVANADRGVPLLDGSVDVVLSLFGRRPGPEIRRVLRSGGALIVALPAEDDLIELREAVLGRAVRRERVEPALAELATDFEIERQVTSRKRASLDATALRDALAATYRGARFTERPRAQALGPLQVTLAADILVLRPRRHARAPRPPAGEQRGFRLGGGRHALVVLHEDADLLVVEKPSGLLTVATSAERRRTAYALLYDHVKRARPPGKVFIVHRLDRDASGLLVFAKTPAAKRNLQQQFARHAAGRVYVAVVEGLLREESRTIRSHLYETRALKSHSTDDRERGRLAITHLRVLARGRSTTRVEGRLETGRKHQLRVHLAEIGHPIAGDRRYGAQTDPLRRLALHATRLSVRHPTTGRVLEFESPVPREFRRVR